MSSSLETMSIASLMLAMASVWLKPAHLWLLPFSCFVAFGLISAWLTPAALGSGALYAGIVRYFTTARTPHARIVSAVLLTLGAFALGLHLLPGFGTVRSMAEVTLPGRGDWHGIGFTADKPLVGLYLLLACRDRLCTTSKELGQAIACVALPTLIGITGVYAFGIALGHVALDPVSAALALVPVALLLLARDFFFTVVAEEMLFRQLVQSGLGTLCPGRHARWLALLAASALFGAVHLPGGWPLGLLATLAGLVYGYAFARSGRIETAMVAHVVLNAGNVLLFTSPAP